MDRRFFPTATTYTILRKQDVIEKYITITLSLSNLLEPVLFHFRNVPPSLHHSGQLPGPGTAR